MWQNKYQIMVSDSFGFTGPYISWAVLRNTSKLRLPVDYHNYQGLSIYFDGNSDKSDFFFKTKEEN